MEMTPELLKQAVKQGVIEALDERQELLYESILERLEDEGMLRAIREGQGSGLVSREKVFEALRSDD